MDQFTKRQNNLSKAELIPHKVLTLLAAAGMAAKWISTQSKGGAIHCQMAVEQSQVSNPAGRQTPKAGEKEKVIL